VPGDMIGKTIRARADKATVKLYAKGQLIKVHPRKPPGARSTDPDDLPSERSAYAMRDIAHLVTIARSHGKAIGDYAEALLDHPLPWTKMRQTYRLLGLVKKWGASRVEQACTKALEAEAVNVNLIARMIERATEADAPQVAIQPKLITGRFARETSEFKGGVTR
jgi:hypothetical protein